MREHKNEICIYLSIQGEVFDPKDFTDKVGIVPTKVYRKGDIIPMQGKIFRKPDAPAPKYKKTAWQYDLGYQHTLDSDDISDVLEERFSRKVALIKEYIRTHDLVVRLNVVLEIDPEQTPAVGFKPSFIKLLAALDAEIDMDMYVITLDEAEKEALYYPP